MAPPTYSSAGPVTSPFHKKPARPLEKGNSIAHQFFGSSAILSSQVGIVGAA
jgi:hypothetical protein